jgi:hypothetical protein
VDQEEPEDNEDDEDENRYLSGALGLVPSMS